MWRRWVSVGALAAGVWGGWAGASIVPVERRVDVKATLSTGLVDDPAEVAVGGEYGTHTAKAEVREQRVFMTFPVEVFSTVTVTSVVQPDMLRVDVQSVNGCTFEGGPFYGQGDGEANITFDLAEPTKFRVNWNYDPGLIAGALWIPCLVQGQPGAESKLIYWGHYPSPETDAIYECGPGRYTLTVSQRDDHMAGATGQGHLWIEMQVVPEPGIAGLMAIGAVGMLWRRRGGGVLGRR